MPSILVLSLLALSMSAARAAEIYRWVGEDGRVNYGDVVPDAYKHRARPLNLPDTTLTEAQRQAAQQAVDKLIDAVRSDPSGRPDQAPPILAPGPSAPASAPARTAASDSSGGCEDKWRQFDESLACFNPYRVVGGGVKAQAFKNCQEVKMPTECPLPSEPSHRR